MAASNDKVHPAQLHLGGADPVLARIIDHVGGYSPNLRPARFQALVHAIIFQQLAGRAANAIYQRFTALFPGERFPTAEQVLALAPSRMRKSGLSRAKTIYIKELAIHVAERKLNFRKFPRMEDEAIIAELTQVRGIGRWTAEMFLMFNLGRPDVLPVGDLGFRNAVSKAYGLKQHPTPRELREIAERWRPYRSAAVWYLWQSLRIVLPDGEKPAPKSTRSPKSKPRKKAGKSAR